MDQHPILGREEELAAVDRFINPDGAGSRALVLEGEAGLGKTILWSEGVRLAEGKGVALVSRASEAERRLSFAVLGDLLGSALGGTLEGLPAGQRGALEAALLLGPPAGSRPDARAVSLAVLGVLRSLASTGPVTVAIDDVQWTDPPSARALSFALRRLEQEPIAILATRRIAPDLDDPLDLAGLKYGVDRLTIGPIGAVPLGTLLRERLGRPFAAPLVKRIHEASGGNPFFAVEIGRALGLDDSIPKPGEPLPVPQDLQELLRRRLARLSASASQALLIAACSASPTPAVVEGAGGTRSGLDDAEEAGIVEIGRGAIDFTHPLLASTVYTGATSRARRDVHARLARLVTEPEERARHLALSIDGPSEDAAAALEQAAQHAEARGAPTAAAELYQLAATVTPPTAIDVRRRRRHGALGNLWAAGDVGGARDLNERLLAELDASPGRAHTLYVMASISWNDVTQVTSLLRQALDEVGDDRPTRAYILAELAWAALWACEPTLSVGWSDAALEIAEGLDETGPLRATLSARAMALGLLGRDGNDLLERGISLEGTAEYNDLSTPRMCLGRLQMWAGALDIARTTFEEELDRRLEHGHETSTWEVRAGLAEVELRAGRWVLAARHAQEALEILVEAGWSDVVAQILPLKAAIECTTGDTLQARIDASEALRTCEVTGDRWDEIQARSALGLLELSLGDHAACHGWLGPLVELTSAADLREPGAFPFVPDEVEALVALGKLEAAGLLTDRLEEQGRTLDRPLALATSARCRALLAAAHRDQRAAEDQLTQALRHHASVPQPFELGRTLLAGGGIHRGMGRKKAARELLHEALGIFDELGAPLWAAKARTELARIGGRTPSPAELTPTEEQVARLVAGGGTNREVAEALFMSVHTVDAHLRRIYRKLQVRSRTELARKL